MEKINILYIDDNPDPNLGKYLDTEFNNPDYMICYDEIAFVPSDGYESLIKNPSIQSANIIIIDSRLFEYKTATSGKFSGEEFKIILKKYYPFIEVIVITQNGEDPEVGKISKHMSISRKQPTEYYNETLAPIINDLIKRISQYRKMSEKLQQNNSWDHVLKEKIINSLQGIGIYDELTKSDIDRLIVAFTEIQEKIDDK